MDVVLGVDIGGTFVKAATFTPDGEQIESHSFATPQLNNQEAYSILHQGLRHMTDKLPDAHVLAVGIDCPGPISETGKLLMTANMQFDLEGLKASLTKEFGCVPVVVLNDANAAALGEMWRGGAHAYRNFCMITLGTGVGGALVVDGKVVAGHHGCAGEFGHVILNYDEREKCGCGRSGCLEQYASASGIVRLYKKACEAVRVEGVELNGPADSKTIFDAAANGDEQALFAVEYMCDYLARGLASIAVVTNPEAFVFGGGVSYGFHTFAPILRSYFEKYTLSSCTKTAFVAAELGNDAGSYGAAYEALRSLEI